MFEKLKKLLNNSYAPYSNFRVGAIVSSISAGYKKNDFETLYLIVDSEKIAYPCNLCRQVFVEFFNDDMKIVCYNKNGESNTVTVKDLCTYSFNSEDLK